MVQYIIFQGQYIRLFLNSFSDSFFDQQYYLSRILVNNLAASTSLCTRRYNLFIFFSVLICFSTLYFKSTWWICGSWHLLLKYWAVRQWSLLVFIYFSFYFFINFGSDLKVWSQNFTQFLIHHFYKKTIFLAEPQFS